MSLHLPLAKFRFKRGGIVAIGVTGVLAGAVALVPVSGAWFTDTKSGTLTVTGRTLGLSITGPNNTFDAQFDDLVPGGSSTQTFTYTNNGTVDANVSFTLDPSTSTGLPQSMISYLKYSVDGDGRTFSMDSAGDGITLDVLKPNETRTLTITASLDENAGNIWQGARVSTPMHLAMTQV